jgi:hypothetical protein
LCASVEQINIRLLFLVVCDGNRIRLCFRSNWFKFFFENDQNQKLKKPKTTSLKSGLKVPSKNKNKKEKVRTKTEAPI